MLGQIEEYIECYLLENILKKTKFVDEILIAKVDADENFKVENNLGKIKYLKFGCPTQSLFENIPSAAAFGGIQHAHGLHACIERAKNDLILLSDPDILFYENVDEIYLNLLDTYKLNLVGCSHPKSIEFTCGYYPNHLNMLLRKSDIPNTDFLNDHLKNRPYKTNDIAPISYKFPGKWLIPGAIPEYADLFPNKNGYFETGCNLYILGQQQNWRWLSFQTIDCVNYSTLYRRCNFKPLPTIKNSKLLFHLNNSFCITSELAKLDNDASLEPTGMNSRERYNNFIAKFNQLTNLSEFDNLY
jgi:hypothetical protein